MYDYISIHSNDYSLKIKSGVLENFIIYLGFKKVSHLEFIKEINGERIKITGILADLDCCYSFDALDGIEEINLIEIDLPLYIDDNLEQVISKLAIDIAKKFSWIIDEDHGLFN